DFHPAKSIVHLDLPSPGGVRGRRPGCPSTQQHSKRRWLSPKSLSACHSKADKRRTFLNGGRALGWPLRRLATKFLRRLPISSAWKLEFFADYLFEEVGLTPTYVQRRQVGVSDRFHAGVSGWVANHDDPSKVLRIGLVLQASKDALRSIPVNRVDRNLISE